VRVRAAHLLLLLPLGLIFDLAYSQRPLYDGMYNSYLLHGLACAGEGDLAADWTAGTTDPFPLVSALVCATARWGHPALFYLLHALLLAVYVASLLAIFVSVFRVTSPAVRLAFGAGCVLLHSVLLRDLVSWASGGDWGWYLQAGLARQYLLGFFFQPSLFGVLNVAAIALFLRRRDGWAAALAAGSSLAHFSYALTAASLILAFALFRLREDRGAGAARPALLVGGAVMLASALLAGLRFRPSSPATFSRAQALIATERIPHHALPARWVHESIWIQAAALGLGLLAAPALRLLLLVPLGVGAALTGLQIATGSNALALLFPWRVSTLLVPLGSSMALGRATAALEGASRRAAWSVALAGAALALFAAVHAARQSAAEHRAYARDPDLPMMRHVRAARRPGQLYVIPVGLQRFRIETGAPTLVDWKTHPYRDVEVLEWYARIGAARRLERASGPALCAAANDLIRRHGVTHLVLPAGKPCACAGLRERYRDRRFAIFAAAQGPGR